MCFPFELLFLWREIHFTSIVVLLRCCNGPFLWSLLSFFKDNIYPFKSYSWQFCSRLKCNGVDNSISIRTWGCIHAWFDALLFSPSFFVIPQFWVPILNNVVCLFDEGLEWSRWISVATHLFRLAQNSFLAILAIYYF
jgi:hypothetical protein